MHTYICNEKYKKIVYALYFTLITKKGIVIYEDRICVFEM